MELSDNQIERLIEIVQQYEVIYGGGISSKDQRVREECEDLIETLEKLRRNSKRKKKTIEELKEKSENLEVAPIAQPKGKKPSRKTKKKSDISTTVEIPPVEKETPKKEPSQKTTKRKKPEEVVKEKITPPKRKKKLQAVHLFEAYRQGKLPKYGGYIVSSNFQPDTNYSIFEIAGYDNVQEIRLEGDTLVFKSAGCKLYVLIEPANYPFKNIEPVQRESGKSIPYRFSELFTLTTKKHDTVYIGKKPIISYSSFTIVKPRKNDFAILFYNVPDVFDNIYEFLTSIFNKGVGILKRDAQKAAKITVQGIKNFTTWLDL